MIIWQTRCFERWARKEGLDPVALCQAIQEMAEGLYEADLGGGLMKKRVARAGQGKSGGYRTLVATNRKDRWFFVYGFPKSVRANIDAREEAALKKLSATLLALKPAQISKAVAAGELKEVRCNG